MKHPLLVLIFALPLSSFAQRDAPVWESYLTRISVYDNNRTSSVLELDYKKEGGHYVHDHHQLYVMAYLQKDEAEILKMVPKEEAPKKKGPAKKFFLDLLIEKKLVKVLQTKATKVHPWNYKDQHDRRNHVYSFKFHFEHKALFETVESLANFDSDNVSVYGTQKDITLYGDKFKDDGVCPGQYQPVCHQDCHEPQKAIRFSTSALEHQADSLLEALALCLRAQAGFGRFPAL